MKRILMYSVMAVLVLSMFMLPNQVLVSYAETVVTQQEAVDWIVAAENNYWDWDKSDGAQCVDLIYYYYDYLGVSPMGGNANHYIYDNLSGCKVPDGWERIQYYSGFIAQPGDVALWDYGEYGHIGLIVNADPYGITTLENNRYDRYGTSNALSGWRAYDSLNFWGVIRPAFPKTTLVISYDVNGGSWQGLGNYVTQSKLRDNPVTLLQSHPTRPGFDFIGWSTNPYATQAQYQPGDVYTENWNLSLYAVWQIDPANAFTISYNANGGSGAPRDQIKGRGYDLTLSNERPVREGYTFAGWSTDPYATSATYSAGGKFTIDANTTLYAVWDIAGLYSEIENGEVTITSYSGTLSVFNIPETINGYPVTAIGNYAFDCCDSLTSVVIPDSVKTIGFDAFYCCSNLTTVNIGKGVESIGRYAFTGCYSLSKIWVHGDNPHYYVDSYGVLIQKSNNALIEAPVTLSGSYRIPDGITIIEAEAFHRCSGLTSITIPNSVTSIGSFAFYSCSQLTSITIPDGVTSIGDYAFYNCSSLTSIIIPESVTYISEFAFFECSSLQGIWVDENNQHYKSDDRGVLFNKEGTQLYRVPSGITGDYRIPDGVTEIYSAANSPAFWKCNQLRSITIPGTIKDIPATDFSDCENLITVIFEEGVESIGAFAFSRCPNLTTVRIPDSLLSIGPGDFGECTDLKYNIYDNGKYLGNEKNPFVVLIDTVSDTISSINVHPNTKVIASEAFNNCSELIQISLSNSVNDIGKYALASCSKLQYQEYNNCKYLGNENNPYVVLIEPQDSTITTCEIHKNTKGIGDGAFSDCPSLTSVTIPDSVNTIGEYAFQNCTSLTSVTIPDSVTSIGERAFYNCNSLTSITIPYGVTTIGYGAFSDCANLTSITIPDSVTTIGYWAFSYCESLTSVFIPDSVTTIDHNAFYDCTGLETVYYTGTEEQWKAISVGYNNDVLLNANIIYNCKPAKPEYYTYEIHNGEATITGADTAISADAILPSVLGGYPVTAIGNAAFAMCENLTSVTIPDSVIAIGDEAFSDCTSLTTVVIPDSVTTIGDLAFSYCAGLTSVVIPGSVTAIGDGVFFFCESLTKVTIGSGAATIGESAFYGCESLTAITIPDGVTTIGYDAFAYCERMTSITIPDSVTNIAYGAFSDCGALETVYYTGTEEQWKEISIGEGNDALRNATIIYQEEPEYGEVEGWNLILKEDIGVQFQLSFSEEIQADENAYVEITVAGETSKIPVADALEGIAADVAPAQMTEDICITIVSGNGTRDEVGTYTVRSYADYILAGDYTNQTKMMVKYMLSYGAAAQKYFGYNESALANDGISCNLAAVPAAEETAVSVKGTMADIAFYGASLRYDNKIALRYYFTGDAAGCTFTANGKKLTPVEKDGRCYVEIGEILPQDLDESFSVTVTDSDGSCLIATYSPMNYIVRMYHKADATQETKDLLQALYTYHYAAKSL